MYIYIYFVGDDVYLFSDDDLRVFYLESPTDKYFLLFLYFHFVVFFERKIFFIVHAGGYFQQKNYEFLCNLY